MSYWTFSVIFHSALWFICVAAMFPAFFTGNTDGWMELSMGAMLLSCLVMIVQGAIYLIAETA